MKFKRKISMTFSPLSFGVDGDCLRLSSNERKIITVHYFIGMNALLAGVQPDLL